MIRLALIGTGNMGRQHAQALSSLKGASVVACCDIDPKRTEAFAEAFKVPSWYTSFEEMLDKTEVDGVINATVDAMHAPVALATLKKKIPLFSEKPMADTLDKARIMYKTYLKAGVPAMVNFSYRNSACLQAASSFIASGGIGRVMHVEASYLQSWLVQSAWGNWRTEPTWTWRLSTKHGSGGVLGDVGCHIYDLVSFLCGDMAVIDCRLKNFHKGVARNRIGPYILDANDSFFSTVTFANGGMGTVHATRWATGHMNSLRARVYGDRGAIEIDLDRGTDHYLVVAGEDVSAAKWKPVTCKPTPTNLQKFLKSIKTGNNDVCDFTNGLKVQAYLHCSKESDEKQGPVKVPSL